MLKRNILFLVIIALLLIGIYVTGTGGKSIVKNKTQTSLPVSPTSSTTSAGNITSTSTATNTPNSYGLVMPIAGGLSRVTKKFFGTYVTPENSPVQPERFTGYHTGIDFETYPSEASSSVPVYTICTGPLLLKEWASGYGGVAVQKCTIAGNIDTVIYGHLYINSIQPTVGEQLQTGQELGILGQGYSQQTDGERKNLHLGIHKGSSIDILGYVQTKADLSGWLDPMQYLEAK